MTKAKNLGRNKKHTAAKKAAPMKKKRERAKSAFEDALDLYDMCGLPQGAAWALAEEMSGIEPGDGIDYLDLDDDRDEQ